MSRNDSRLVYSTESGRICPGCGRPVSGCACKKKKQGMNQGNTCQPDATVLLKLAGMRMPFGKYKDRRLIDLPEPYVIWLARKGYPDGQLGDLLRMLYEIKVNGLEYLFEPLRNLQVNLKEDFGVRK